MSESDKLIQNVIESIDEAKRHRLELQELVQGLEEAKQQVKESAEKAQQKLCDHFTSLKVCVVNTLEERLNVLRKDVANVEKSSLEPLDKCEALLLEEVKKADSILLEGKKILSDVDSPESAEKMKTFKSKASAMDLNSLPEVPSLQEVACIHVDLPQDGADIEAQLVEAIEEYGQVLGHAPVQVVETQPRAGAILVKWAESQSDDHEQELTEFSVRCCQGDLHSGPHIEDFRDVYLGQNQQTLVRGLTAGVTYSFQVRGRVQGDDRWSPWSVPFVGITLIGPYNWQAGVSRYELSTDRTTVCTSKSTDTAEPLYSSGAIFHYGHSLTFKVLSCGETNQNDAIGLCLSSDTEHATNNNGTLFVSTDGRVFVDGQEKTTRLPGLRPRSVVSFDTEVLSSSKVRVTTEIDDKILTVDWCVERGSEAADSMSTLMNVRNSLEVPQHKPVYFYTRLHSAGWKMTVE